RGDGRARPAAPTLRTDVADRTASTGSAPPPNTGPPGRGTTRPPQRAAGASHQHAAPARPPRGLAPAGPFTPGVPAPPDARLGDERATHGHRAAPGRGSP